MKAIWNGQVIAKSEQTIFLEGNHYFPAESVRQEFLLPSETHTVCPWKEIARYYHIKIGDPINQNAAWYYSEPSEAAKQIQGHIAF